MLDKSYYRRNVILLQVIGKYDREYIVHTKREYTRKLAEIRLAMMASGDEYYVFLVHKSKPNRHINSINGRNLPKKGEVLT